MLNIIKALLFGLVEGITEWLPISSTGHMILFDSVVKLDVSPEFYSMFQVVIQLGAIMAVIVLFWNQLWPFGRKNNRFPLAASGPGRYIKKMSIKSHGKILKKIYLTDSMTMPVKDKKTVSVKNYIRILKTIIK